MYDTENIIIKLKHLKLPVLFSFSQNLRVSLTLTQCVKNVWVKNVLSLNKKVESKNTVVNCMLT